MLELCEVQIDDTNQVSEAMLLLRPRWKDPRGTCRICRHHTAALRLPTRRRFRRWVQDASSTAGFRGAMVDRLGSPVGSVSGLLAPSTARSSQFMRHGDRRSRTDPVPYASVNEYRG